jgi:hypothetical protein
LQRAAAAARQNKKLLLDTEQDGFIAVPEEFWDGD